MGGLGGMSRACCRLQQTPFPQTYSFEERDDFAAHEAQGPNTRPRADCLQLRVLIVDPFDLTTHSVNHPRCSYALVVRLQTVRSHAEQEQEEQLQLADLCKSLQNW